MNEPLVAILSVGAFSQHLLKMESGDGAMNYMPIVAVITADIRFKRDHDGAVDVIEVSIQKYSPVVGDGRVAPFSFVDDERIAWHAHSETSFSE